MYQVYKLATNPTPTLTLSLNLALPLTPTLTLALPLPLPPTPYQFSLDAYVSLFTISLDKSARSDDLQERIKSLNEYHTFFVYRSTCRALFEMHKLLFAFQICAKILLGAKKMNQAEHDFFLRGGQVFNKDEP